jgi:hypothetical protein
MRGDRAPSLTEYAKGGLAMGAEVRRAISRLGVAVRTHGRDHPDTARARRELATAKLAEHAAEVARSMPPLSAADRDRIVSILHAAPVGDDMEGAA